MFIKQIVVFARSCETLPVTVNLPHAVGGREVGSDGRGGGGQHKRLERSLAILYSPPCTGRVSCKPLHAVFWKHFQFFWHARIDFGVLVLVINVWSKTPMTSLHVNGFVSSFTGRRRYCGNIHFNSGWNVATLCTNEAREQVRGRAPDSWSKGRGFESPQERREIFFSVVNFLCWLLFRYCSTPCCRSSM